MDGLNATRWRTQDLPDGSDRLFDTDPDGLGAAWSEAVSEPQEPRAAPPAIAPTPAGPPEAALHLHIVRSGETLSGIARRSGTSWQSLARANHISDPTQLRAGTLLRSPSGTSMHQAGHLPAGHLQAGHLQAGHLQAGKPSTGPATPAANGGLHLGDLSMRFETGYRPGQEAEAAGTVSSGAGDKGGVSYGAYQLASSDAAGKQVQAFLKAEGAPWAAEFRGMDPSRRNGDFAAAWKQVAAQEPKKFFAAQHAYIQRTHDQPVVDHVKAATGLDISSRSQPVQNAVWSMSVQHGRAASLVDRAVRLAGPQGGQSDAEYDRKLVNALYDVRDNYVDALGQPNLKTRYAQERKEALQQIR